jgi:hypothetical protein
MLRYHRIGDICNLNLQGGLETPQQRWYQRTKLHDDAITQELINKN